MERKGECCVAPRYGAAAAAQQQQQAGAAWQMGRIMLKFRPIAPKPAAMAPVANPAPVPAAGAGRGKRKAAAGGGGRRGRKPKKAATVTAAAADVVPAAPAVGDCRKEKECSEKEKSLSSRSSSSSGMTSVDSSPPPPPSQQPQPPTLPLMPVSPAEDKAVAAAAAGTEEPAPGVSLVTAGEQSPPVPPRALIPAAWVTVEEVTATWRAAEDAPPSSAADDAPAFVSDQWGRVTWTNAAFARAVSADASDGDARAVALAGAFPAWGTCAGFTCRARVFRHTSTTSRRVGSGSSVVAPCDVWRLDAGGCYLWRLDLQAALTLGGLP